MAREQVTNYHNRWAIWYTADRETYESARGAPGGRRGVFFPVTGYRATDSVARYKSNIRACVFSYQI